MTLPEKIFSCRRRLGLSQEQLAERLGVSRQAVSKWETGEAAPELGKLSQLAAVFGVTADWLLSEEETMPQAAIPLQTSGHMLPRRLGDLLRRWGWLAGLYPMGSGLVLGLLALFSRSRLRQELDVLESLIGSEVMRQSPTYQMYCIYTAVLAVAAVLFLGGAALALFLRHRGKEKKTV